MSRIEEIKERLEAATPGPWSREDYVDVDQDGAFNLAHVTAPDPEEPDVAVQGVVLGSLREDAELIANAPDDLAYLLAELEKTRRAARTLGKIVDRQCIDVLNATGMHHVIDEDGDGDWEVVWERLAEMRTELSEAKAKLNQDPS